MTEDSFGQRLKAALNSRQMMQKELAEKIGVNEMAISRYVHGGRMVSVSILIDICKALNVSADYLLGLSEVEACMPPVTPTRKKGRWIKEYDNSALDGLYHCSICGRKLWIPKEESVLDYPYCHCGAEMEREV